VPLTRRVVAAALDSIGATDECRYDVQLAIAEACSNVVRHADPADKFDVSIILDDCEIAIEVLDAGAGFDPAVVDEPSPNAESGRGLKIMRLVTDRFELRQRAGGGTVVRFVKRLAWARATIGLLSQA